MNEQQKAQMPDGFIPIESLPTEYMPIALWYLRIKLLMGGDEIGKHVCNRCCGTVRFSSADIKSDNYNRYVVAYCENCRVKSDNHIYPKYNHSVIEFAEGALTDAINDLQEKVRKL